MPDSFQLAAQQAEAAYGDQWYSLSPGARVEAIYRELRLIDAERAASKLQPEYPAAKTPRLS